MTGKEALIAELKKRGCKSVHEDNQIVAAMLDIFTQNGTTEYSDIAEERRRLSNKKAEYARREMWIRDEERRLADVEKRLTKKESEIKDYIERWYDAIKNCETAEGKDSMRRAQLFCNAVEINSKYDNTAYIIGLSAILTNGQIGAIDELKQINPKLFQGEVIQWR